MHSHESFPSIPYDAADHFHHTVDVQHHLPERTILTPPTQVKVGGVVGSSLLDHGTNLLNERKLFPRSSLKDGKSLARYAVHICNGIYPLIHSSQRVASAAVSVLGTTGDVIHELLQTGVGFLGFVPVPGLGPAASTLLQIWDTLQQVDVGLLPCLYFLFAY